MKFSQLFLSLTVALLSLGITVPAAAAEVPFSWKAERAGENELVVTAVVAPEYYFYDDTLEFALTGADGSPLQPVETPEPIPHSDEIFGETKIYPAGSWVWKFRGTPPFNGSVDYQGCRKAVGDEPAMCLLPETVPLIGEPQELTAIAADATTSQGETLPAILDEFELVRKTGGLLSENEFLDFLSGRASDDDSGNTWAGRGFWMIVLLTLLGGIGLNLTPCVLPMIPINLAIIGADGADRMAGFRRGLAYGLGMAVSYGVLGVVVVLTGARFGELNANCWFNFAVALIFLILALAMFGVFNLDISHFSSGVSARKIRGGKTVAAFVLGAVAALLAGACVAPVVISVLLLAAGLYQDGNPAALGLPLLLGVGMALPWPIAGAGIGVLPKPGRFMVIVKNVFGVFILLAALYYAYLGYGLLSGKFDPDREIAQLEQSLTRARRENKLVLIDFWATWCKNCKSMERNVLSQPAVQEAMKPFAVVKFQAENLKNPAVRTLLDRYGIPGLPAFVILRALPPLP